MKKIYLVLAVLFCSFIATQGFAQYSTVRSGNWNGTGLNSPWATVKPSNPCNNCTIVISTGDAVTLDASVVLTGNSVLAIRPGASLIIKNSNSNSIGSANNLTLDNTTGSSKIVLGGPNPPNPAALIDATNAGNYDGVFVIKYIGNSNNTRRYIILGNKNYGGNNGTIKSFYLGTSLSGPSDINSNGVLPIVLANFNAALVNNAANLTWSTFSELNFSHYEIERSGDQSTWSTIGTVQGQNSPTGANYSYTDNEPLHGNNYYRLKAVDIDGKYAFSDIQSVRTATLAGVRFGPNPAVNQLGVTFGSNISSNVFLRMVSPTGQVMQEKQLRNVAGSTVILPVQNFPPGLYILQVKTDDGSQNSFKFIVAH